MARLKSRDQIRFLVSLIITISAITVLISYWFYIEVESRYRRERTGFHYDEANQYKLERKLLSINDTEETVSGEYPNNIFTVEERRNGAVILHIIGISYMFLALAIVCDEFFVPALHVISGMLNISDDVAGATFMAAGGSAPELFTSILGVFVAKSNVGFGTIVGSAVFNVLFVIAMCVFFSKGILQLTWWPLLRDCSFYILSLALLIIFFDDSKIQLWESATLFGTYIVYVLFMSINVRAERFVRRLLTTVKGIGTFVNKDAGQEKNKRLLEFGGACFRHGAFQLVVHTLDPITEVPMNKKLSIIREIIESSKESDEGYYSERREVSKFGEEETKTHGEAVSNNFFHRDGQKNSKLNGISSDETISGQILPNRNSNDDPYASYFTYENYETGNEHTRPSSMDWGRSEGIRYKKHSLGDNVKMEPLTELYYGNKKENERKVVHKPSFADQIMVRGHNSEPLEVKQIDKFNDGGYQDSPMSTRSFPASYTVPPPITGNSFDGDSHPRSGSKLSCSSHHGMSRVCLREAAAEAQGTCDEEDEEPLDLKWPDTLPKRIFYLIKFPIVFFLFISIPDVRRAGWKKYFPLAFINSILWIGGFSYLMVWWAALIGEALYIPDEVMGLTFIAAGTSIPDLITSVLVARQGLGDMAISSSIGSNIFDVTVGLPVPWLIYSFLHAYGPIRVNNRGLFCSTLLLFVMLIAIIFLISISKWRMTKALGVGMFALYVVFLTITLLIQFSVIECIL